MAIDGFSFSVSPELGHWIKGLSDLDVSESMVANWTQVNDVFFGRTQEYVHVWHIRGGSLKASGRVSTQKKGTTVEAMTSYGGPSGGPKGFVNYAMYELARGGSHDFFARALTATTETFKGGMQKAMVDEMRKRLT